MAGIDDYQLTGIDYESLGLGRGVNVTDTHMWKNKSSFVVRKISDTNIIKTEESGMFEKYEKVVSTISQEQQKIRLLLDDPSSQIKIGMDAQQTQSVTSRMRIAGTKIKTRTISFCTTFSDLPPYVQTDKPQCKHNEETNFFELKFCLWILDRIRSRESTKVSVEEADMEIAKASVKEADMEIAKASVKEAAEIAKAVKEIFEHYDKCSIEQRKEISNDCEVFVRDLGITHYVSSIELGAMKYSAATISSRERKLGGGAAVGAGKYVEAGLSGFTEKLWFQSHKEERSIGKINDDGTVTRSKENEAVIGFQIKPIYNLTPIPYLQPALQKAVKEYIQRKADPTEGPFLISCIMPKEADTEHTPAENEGTNTVDDNVRETDQGGIITSDAQEDIAGETDDTQGDRTQTKETDKYRKEIDVYWCVSKNNNTVYGTTSPEDASPFHIIPTGDSKYPSEFFVVHWQGNRSRLTNINDPVVRSRTKKTNLPLYLTTNTGLFGQSEGPLQLKSTVLTNQARFCLHSRVQSTFVCMMCLSTPVSLSDWIEGEQFYINCSRRAFKIDGYVAMVKLASEDETQKTYQYKTVTLPSISDPSSSAKGMLFRLHPPLAKRENTRTGSSKTTINPKDNLKDSEFDDLKDSELKVSEGTQCTQKEVNDEPKIDTRTDTPAIQLAQQLRAIGKEIYHEMHQRSAASTMAGQYRMLYGDSDEEGSSV